MSKIARRRRARSLREKQAVSPVVATLILILVAVAAAAALYLWLVAWQGQITGSIGNQNVQSTVSIGGSTSVYPFDQVAVAQFQQNNTNIVVSNNQGGTTAGMIAVCQGAVDVGASSSLQTVAGLETSPFNCPTTVTITTVAYDAVDVIVPAANVHQLGSISFDTLAYVYETTSTSPTLVASTIDGQSISGTILNAAPWNTHAATAWDQLPACVFGATVCMGVTGASLPEALATSIGAGVACPGNAVLVCANAGASPCGFTVCAGGAQTVQTVARSDGSGTTQTFEARLLDATSATAFASTFAGLGFGGCGSNNVIADCGYISSFTGNGNPGVITSTAGHADSLAYASDGLARASGSGVAIIAYNAVGQAQCGAATSTCGNGAVIPTTGSTGTISAGIRVSTTVLNFAGWRPFEWVTKAPPTGEVLRLLQFVTDPANNINFAAETQEISIYQI